MKIIFDNLIRKKPKTPSGYPIYKATDFAKWLCISEVDSLLISSDYLDLIKNYKSNNFIDFLLKYPLDLQSISIELTNRYNLNRKNAVRLAQYFSRVAISLLEQENRIKLGITRCIWVVTTCGLKTNDKNILHRNFSNKEFKLCSGILNNSEYYYPGTSFDCTCIAKAIIETFQKQVTQ